MAAGHDMSGSALSLPELSDLLHTLPGFLLVLTSEGKLLYLSDNVAEHLGHSMVRNININYIIIITICWVHVEHYFCFIQVDLVAQSDSVYDIIDPADHFIMRGNLVPITTTDTGNLLC